MIKQVGVDDSKIVAEFKNIITILIGLILWTIYLFTTEMGKYGMYTIVSFNVSEILVLVPFVCIIITVCWLIIIFVQCIRKKETKANLMLGILILSLAIAQISYIYNQSQLAYVSSVAKIESINEEKLEIVINTEENRLTLDCPMLVQYLLKTDGTEYYITYEWNNSHPNQGKLCMIQSVN